MKRFSLYSLISITTSSFLFCQTAEVIVSDFYPPDSSYSLRLTGAFYEGYSGSQQFLLRNGMKETLWVKTFDGNGLGYPAISNRGQVAVTEGLQVQLFNVDGNLAGIYSLERGVETPYYGSADELPTLVQDFSINGDRYYCFTRRLGTKDRFLVCLDDSAREIWRKNLGNYHPHQFLFYKNKIVVQDCGFAGLGYINVCYIFHRDGMQLWKYQTQSRSGRDWDVRLNQALGILTLTDRGSSKTLKLDTLSNRRD